MGLVKVNFLKQFFFLRMLFPQKSVRFEILFLKMGICFVFRWEIWMDWYLVYLSSRIRQIFDTICSEKNFLDQNISRSKNIGVYFSLHLRWIFSIFHRAYAGVLLIRRFLYLIRAHIRWSRSLRRLSNLGILFLKKYEMKINQPISSMIGIESMLKLLGSSNYYVIVFSYLFLFLVIIFSHSLGRIIM